MKAPAILIISLALVTTASVFAQSGRKNSKPPSAPPPAISDTEEKPAKEQTERNRSQVAAAPNEEYKCVDDGSLVVIAPSSEAEKVFATNEVTTKARIISRPKPEYTTEARHRAVEGIIAVRVILLANGKVLSVKITNKGLPFGLNESAIHAACKIEFTPATKDGQAVAELLKTDFTFRLESSIFKR